MTNRRDFLAAVAAPLTVFAAADDSAQQRIWAPPGDPGLVLRYGPDGIDRRPKPPFTFLEEDLGGTNPNVQAKDAEGITWNVKWAKEVHSETFASRLAATAGYFVRTTYYVPSGRILNCRDLGRAEERIDDDGSFEAAVFKLIPEDQPYMPGKNWAWTDNPFLENPEYRRQLNGLKVMLMLTSNWAPTQLSMKSAPATASSIATRSTIGADRWAVGERRLAAGPSGTLPDTCSNPLIL